MARLTETVLLNEGLSADAVDEAEGVIKGVSLLGKSSKNGRTYSDKAMADAARLYEGAIVNIDHRNPNSSSDRSFMEGGGIIRNTKVADNGQRVRGDFHYLKSHKAAALIVESAKRFPASFGFSHDAEGETKPNGDGMLVESLSHVHSIDIVRRPATNAGLFESEEREMSKPKSRTVKQILEAAPDGDLKTRLTKLVEMEAVAVDAPVEGVGAEPAADPNEDVKAALKKAAAGIVGKMLDGDLDKAEGLKKLRELLGMGEKLEAKAESSSSEAPAMEAIQRELNEIKSKNLLLESGRDATPERVKAVALMPDAERKKLVESWPAKAARNSDPPANTGVRFSLMESEGDDLAEVLPGGKPAWERVPSKKS